MSLTVSVGDPMPSVGLRATDGYLLNLRTWVTKQPVVLLFFGAPTMSGAARRKGQKAVEALVAGHDRLREAGIAVAGVSCDSPEQQAEFVAAQSLPFLLLSDERRSAVEVLGIATLADGDNVNVASPVAIAVDRDGIVRAVIDRVEPDALVDMVVRALSEPLPAAPVAESPASTQRLTDAGRPAACPGRAASRRGRAAARTDRHRGPDPRGRLRRVPHRPSRRRRHPDACRAATDPRPRGGRLDRRLGRRGGAAASAAAPEGGHGRRRVGSLGLRRVPPLPARRRAALRLLDRARLPGRRWLRRPHARPPPPAPGAAEARRPGARRALADAGVTPYRAVRRAAPWLLAGERVLVIGCGGLGQFALQYLRLCPPRAASCSSRSWSSRPRGSSAPPRSVQISPCCDPDADAPRRAGRRRAGFRRDRCDPRPGRVRRRVRRAGHADRRGRRIAPVRLRAASGRVLGDDRRVGHRRRPARGGGARRGGSMGGRYDAAARCANAHRRLRAGEVSGRLVLVPA